MFTSFVCVGICVCTYGCMESTGALRKYKSSALPKSAGGGLLSKKQIRASPKCNCVRIRCFLFFFFFSRFVFRVQHTYRVVSVCHPHNENYPKAPKSQSFSNPSHPKKKIKKRKQTTNPTREIDNKRDKIRGTLRLPLHGCRF